ncbi:FecR family protein [Fodinibius sp.]|uniref:FecR family protein n=1 Tax=Fodinibius sp. TaxID=1872440 RepID=UPI003568723F
MSTEYKWKVIQRYVSGRCSASEQRKVEGWMENDPTTRKLVEEVEQIWSLTPEEDFEVSVKDAWDRFQVREVRKQTSRQRNDRQHYQMGVLVRAAAAILLMAFIGWFSWQYIDESNIETVSSISQVEMQSVNTENGERAQLTFSDGTVITLNAASSLKYPKAFQEAKREIKLKGEAYFEVASNTEKPFVVHVNNVEVEVVGTKFNVRAWEEDSEVSVGVREGKVAVNSVSEDHRQQKDRVLLTEGQYTSVIEGKGLTHVQNIDIEKHLLWINGGLYFDNTPFKNVFRQIEREFNVDITVEDKDILEVPFTSTFEDVKLEKILKVLSASMKMEYRKEEQNIMFYKP